MISETVQVIDSPGLEDAEYFNEIYRYIDGHCNIIVPVVVVNLTQGGF